jgi:hypothetical protein
MFIARRAAVALAGASTPCYTGSDFHPGGAIMGIGRASKIVAGILFIVAALGVSSPVLLMPIGLAVWVLGEAL